MGSASQGPRREIGTAVRAAAVPGHLAHRHHGATTGGGAPAAAAQSGFPTLGQISEVIVRHLWAPFYDTSGTT
jgi:hypothetical protein